MRTLSTLWYTLDDSGKPIPCEDMLEWSRWIESADRSIMRDAFGELGIVSTVFLGLDHSFGYGIKPVLWETMIFGGARDGDEWRYTSLANAKKNHKRLVREFHKKISLIEKQKMQEAEHRRASVPAVAKGGRRIERI